MFCLPYFKTDTQEINTAYRMAVANVTGNIALFQDGILQEEKPCILAGLGYDTPWTRDAAINVWNGMGLLAPEISKNTLFSVLNKKETGYYIDGQYWDKIIWTIGAWSYYLYTGDFEFLKVAYQAVTNTLQQLEQDEFDPQYHLFRGPACYGDGVAAYPDLYAKVNSASILAFPVAQKEHCHDKGVGLPMHALSTNCLYYAAYCLADQMAEKLQLPAIYQEKANAMKEAIQTHFWQKDKGSFSYLVDPFGGSDAQEGLGIAFALLLGVAEKDQAQQVLKNAISTPHGLACVFPSFARYNTEDGMGFGRHSGTVWPHVQGFWADACARFGRGDLFDEELNHQTQNALNNNEFSEIYHPLTGKTYGGLQEEIDIGIRSWLSQPHQTWSATAFLRNILFNVMGLTFSPDGITLSPVGTKLMNNRTLSNLHYRNATLTIHLQGQGNTIKECLINGTPSVPFIPVDMIGEVCVEITLQ